MTKPFFFFFRSLIASFCIFLLSLVLPLLAFSQNPPRSNLLQNHYGYLSKVEDIKFETENQQNPNPELNLVEKPELYKPPLHSQIFNERLTKEFTEKYRNDFGNTELEELFENPNKNYYVKNTDGRFVNRFVEENNEKKAFGEYMIRRTTEFHIDNYARNEPSLRPALKVKEQLSRAEVGFSPQVKVKINYYLSGNYVKFDLDNPWFDFIFTLEMIPEHFGPSRIQEAQIRLGYKLTTTYYLETIIKEIDGKASLGIHKKLASEMKVSFISSTFYHEHGYTLRESLHLFGFTWTL